MITESRNQFEIIQAYPVLRNAEAVMVQQADSSVLHFCTPDGGSNKDVPLD